MLAHRVPPGVQAGEQHPVALLEGHHLGQEHGRFLHQEVAGLCGRDDAERPEMPLHDRGPRGQVELSVTGSLGHAEAASGVDLLDRAPLREQESRHLRDALDAVLEHGEPVVQESVAHVNVDGVDREVVRCSDRHRLIQTLWQDAELRGLRAGG